MKKIIILLSTLIVVVLLLPLLGNKVVEENIQNQLLSLDSKGVAIKKAISKSGYLATSKHYEFFLKDSKLFVEHLNQFSNTQIPSYVNMLLDGMLIGVDVKYSNFLFFSDTEIDIYPLSLAKQTAQSLKKDDKEFYAYIDKFLKNKGLLYHINQNMSTKKFDGFIKDIKEEYTFPDSTITKLEVSGMTYNGQGSVFHPTLLNSKVDKMVLLSTKKNEELEISINDLESVSTFKTQTTYETKIKLKNIKLKESGLTSGYVDMNDVYFDLSANTQKAKAEFYAKSSVKDLQIKSDKLNLTFSDFNYDLSLTDVDKDSFEELRILLQKTKMGVSQDLQQQIEKTMAEMLSNGFTFTIKDISLSKISLENSKNIDGFSLNSVLNLKADANLVKNINTSPAQLLKNVTLDAKLKISKTLFEFITKQVPATTLANSFAKIVDDNYVFDLKIKDSKMSINGKII